MPEDEGLAAATGAAGSDRIEEFERLLAALLRRILKGETAATDGTESEAGAGEQALSGKGCYEG